MSRRFERVSVTSGGGGVKTDRLLTIERLTYDDGLVHLKFSLSSRANIHGLCDPIDQAIKPTA
ncbi:hypothetical protein RUM43_010239 [Polyplax serrata]|uniref:Uncharacterized protein n=1 Tax=Polyplax serrata TaxID=468196 RepID=A0AAN8Q4H1_POLSC